jgi:hypothetical protein
MNCGLLIQNLTFIIHNFFIVVSEFTLKKKHPDAPTSRRGTSNIGVVVQIGKAKQALPLQ